MMDIQLNVGKRNIHQIAEIEFENCFFRSLASEGAFPSQTPFFLFSGQRFIIVWD